MKSIIAFISSFFATTPALTQIKIPADFKIVQIAEDLGSARHITVRDNGDIYIQLRRLENGSSTVALRDSNKDGDYEEIKYFSNRAGTGIQLHKNYLYYSDNTNIYRKGFNGNELVPSGKEEVVVKNFIPQQSHSAKNFVINPQGQLFVNIGAPSNSCQEDDRKPGSPGLTPCPYLKLQAGVWVFDANKLGQTQKQGGSLYAGGLRNMVALDWNDQEKDLFGVQHGRDQLHTLFPEHYTEQENADLPAEEFLRLAKGSMGAWPFAYYDQNKKAYMQAPEYGGDGEKKAEQNFTSPVYAFPGHWAPNDLLFYTGDMFPEYYKNGAFIAFHGSWNRAPLDQKGYVVGFVPLKNGVATKDDFDIFADNFTGKWPIGSPSEAENRPMGLAQGPQGELYIVDSVQGNLWKVTY